VSHGLKRIAAHVFAGFAVLASFAANGAEPQDKDAPAAPLNLYEVTPFAGYRFGGNFDVSGSTRDASLADHGSFALALDLRRDEESQYELLYSRQQASLQPDSPVGPADVNVEYLQLGGTLDVYVEQPLLKPYVVGTLGLTRFTPDAGAGNDDTRFSVSLGAGLRVPVTPHFGLRFEARGYVTFINTDSSVFCASGSFGGVCAIRAKGSTFAQYELLAGAAFAF
jgi:opacity protein-like surface antigen